MFDISETHEDHLVLDVKGKLTRTDYEEMVPRIENQIQKEGPLRVLIRLRDFGGWEPQALPEELKFDARHRKDFERIAVVGERALEKWVTNLTGPLFSGDTQFFEDETSARSWLATGDIPPS